MALPKIYDTPAEAVADIPDGAVIMSSGFGGAGGRPVHLAVALSARGVKDLTIIEQTMGVLGLDLLGTPLANMAGLNVPPDYKDLVDLYVNKQVKKLITPVIPIAGNPTIVEALKEMIGLDVMEIELLPQGTFAERIRAGGAGIKGFFTAVSAGTIIGEGKETRVIDGELCVLEPPMRADYALIRAYKADRLGNLIYRGTSRSYGPIMATAADVTIVEVDEIVEVGELDPEVVVTPGIYVDRMVKVPPPFWTYNELCIRGER
ncbi:MAG: 3-oxoacid CoA-transferase subunit A [Chloroflexota bacterium]|nr:3-oxoacid CoA-transferase subunit A [Chloroflexota bacterium]